MIAVPANWYSNRPHTITIRLPKKEDCCSKKCRYSSYFLATKVAKRQQEKTGNKLRVYECPYCNGFHLTHTEKNND